MVVSSELIIKEKAAGASMEKESSLASIMAFSFGVNTTTVNGKQNTSLA